ncbi:ABC transporter ATP-binding protein [Deinococcus radiopugnans]|uniref:ABC transporter ATP-binding protein n=2 Tax=Deinococcus radiopugnans TaxID=57497 RepID=A0A5C4Y951_9DEIO|nr:ABC transporter ATP-binding protein [Deinococcus radiopugnans]MBB6017036.1 iron(III) transport system ATP-binding protein [Deinococcus radiopugnans ATCC 19172]TNM71577.1 ABC transporter ATP-binding protein [Deinococcus radiopugnans ATCC 19172]
MTVIEKPRPEAGTADPLASVPPALELQGLVKYFHPQGRPATNLPPAVDGLSLQVAPGELLTLLGPSGCGKTTTLRLIAGLEEPDGGAVWIGGHNMTNPPQPPERRGVGLVFQDYALFPHLSVLGNVLFGLNRLPRAERLARARETLSLVGLTVFETRMPHQLSGGQQQRVALARALAPRPRLLLLDEPFSNLDAQLRHSTRQEVRAILRRSGVAAILVTHDQEEALAFSDRIALMRAGVVVQIGTPQDVYARPRTAFVASFLGRSNLLSGTVQAGVARTVLGQIALEGEAPPDGPVMVSVRPEHLAFAAEGAGAEAVVLAREFRGHAVTYTLALGQQEVQLHDTGQALHAEGQRVWVCAVRAGRVVR